jgi:DNA-binding GntR family transcriptional regulator
MQWRHFKEQANEAKMDKKSRGVRQKQEYDTLMERAYAQIRARILQGVYPLGAPISRRRLAADLGMSFLPISEALQRLEQEGLVESKPRVGTRVHVPSAEDIRERYLLREALETQSAREFAEHSSPGQKEDLQRMAMHLDRLYESCAAAQPDPDFLFSVHTYHMNFHMRIADAPNCHLLRDAIEREQVLIFNWLFDTAAERRSLPQDFHKNLALGLNSGDPEKACTAMRAHIRYGMENIVEVLKTPASMEWRETATRHPSTSKRKVSGRGTAAFQRARLVERDHDTEPAVG